MAAGPTTLTFLDGLGNSHTGLFYSTTGDGTGNLSPMPVLVGADGATLATTSNPVPAEISQGGNVATVTAFHSTDNQNLGAATFGINTGGVAQLLNAAGNVDRQRETSFDNVPQAGVASGAQQLAGPPLATTITQNVTGSGSSQTVTVAATSFTNRGVTTTLQVGSLVQVGTGAQLESVFLTAVVAGTSVTGIFKNNHTNGDALTGFAYSQQRDATIPDGSTPAGINAGMAYLFNASNNTVEAERSFNGEKAGATGTGSAIAVEYEDSSGGPVLASGLPSGLRLFPGQNLTGKGKSASTAITSTTAGNTSLTLTGGASAGNSLPAGHPIQLSGSGTLETVFTTAAWTPGSSATVPLQSPVVNTGQTSAIWDIFAANGPGLTGFLPHGIGIEEEALYNPVDGLYYIERSATQDSMPAANIVAESLALWNGATMDRLQGTGGAANVRQLATGTPITASSGNVANASAVATLAGAASKTTYITGFQVSASGATSGLPVTVTVAGVITGTMSYTFTFPAGVLVGATPLTVNFPQPVPASATNTAIVVTCPAGGSGNTNATCSAQGFQL